MDFALSTLQGEAGALAVYDWPAPDRPPRGTVLLVHGLGEHAGRYGEVAAHLRRWGFAVRGYDHQGHGRSQGARGQLRSERGLLDDLARVIDATRAQPALARGPLVLLGHSMGALLVACAVAQRLRPVDALVMSSPAFGTWATRWQQWLLAVLPRLWPSLTLGNGLDPRRVARDPDAVAAYIADPLVHDRISARLGGWIDREGPMVLAQAAQWSVPSLLVYAGEDRLVRPDACAEFARRAPGAVLRAQCFAPMYHEVFNDPQRALVLQTLSDWLDERLPG